MESSNKIFAENLKKRRVALRLSQAELAQLSGLASTTISRYESGALKCRVKNLDPIAAALQCEVKDLLTSYVPNKNAAPAMKGPQLEIQLERERLKSAQLKLELIEFKYTQLKNKLGEDLIAALLAADKGDMKAIRASAGLDYGKYGGLVDRLEETLDGDNSPFHITTEAELRAKFPNADDIIDAWNAMNSKEKVKFCNACRDQYNMTHIKESELKGGYDTEFLAFVTKLSEEERFRLNELNREMLGLPSKRKSVGVIK